MPRGVGALTHIALFELDKRLEGVTDNSTSFDRPAEYETDEKHKQDFAASALYPLQWMAVIIYVFSATHACLCFIASYAFKFVSSTKQISYEVHNLGAAVVQ
jgi:hypothetical protein